MFAPVSVPAAAVTVMAWLPLKSTPFIALAVFKVSAVVAAPEVHTVLSPELVPSIDEAPAARVRTEVFAPAPVNPTVPVSTVIAVVSVALVTVSAFPFNAPLNSTAVMSYKLFPAFQSAVKGIEPSANKSPSRLHQLQ